jgi:hypothetical protein
LTAFTTTGNVKNKGLALVGRLDSIYCSGRSPDWLKMKNPDAQAVKREAELADDIVVGRIMRAAAAPVGSPWMWTLLYEHHEDRTPHGYAATREEAMVRFAKSWRRK